MKLASLSCAALAALAVGLGGGIPAAAEEAELETTAPLFTMPAMNVFRRFDPNTDAEAMFSFYGDALGLDRLQAFDVGGGTNVFRFNVGRSEVKLTRRVPNKSYEPGAVDDATGLRLLTFFYPNREELIERFQQLGLAAPEFEPVPGSDRWSAIVYDPDGHAVEIVVAPNAPQDLYNSIEIGLTVSDLDESREFYREFVGLEELDPVDDHRFDTKKYSYRHGSTTVSLRHFGADLPADTGTGGIQYVVSSADEVDVLARERNISVDQPLSTLAGFNLRTIWLNDPDGITNYFAQTGRRDGN